MHNRKIRVTFKDPNDKAKKYAASKVIEIFDTLDEAAQELGKIGALDKINLQVEREQADLLRAKLKAKVTGKADTSDVEDLSELID